MSKKSSTSNSLKSPNPKNDQTNLGAPGYRTREDRSGYDPIDTDNEAGHMAGTIIQKLFAGQIRNPIHLFLLDVLGLIFITPLVLAILETMNGNLLPWNAWILLLITGIVGIAILVNFIKNLIKVVFR